ncbi:MAG TPA: sugar ABC transporter permease [Chloroflexota bacterium]|nr:sugar ABC transporter permease [Chloroflexota bacterium]
MKSYTSNRLKSGAKPLATSPPTLGHAVRRWMRTAGINEGLLFILPALLVYCGVVVYPLLTMFYLGAFSWDGLSPSKLYVGMANFQQLLTDPIFYVTLRNSVIWIVFGGGLGLTVSLGLALLVNQRLRGRTVFRTIYFLPGTVSVIVIGQVWGWIYQGDYGVLNNWLGAVGLEGLKQSWLGDPGIAIYAAAIVALWAGVGFPMMVYLAGLQTIPHEIPEAAQVDGATAWQRFRSVTFPLLLPQTVTLTILTVIGTLREFTIIYVLTEGGPAHQTELPSVFVFDQAFNFGQQGYASAASAVIFLISLAITLLQLRLYRWYQGY